MKANRNRWSSLLAVVVLAFSGAAVYAGDEIPETTPEGMKLVKHTRNRVVWAMPGASLEGYTKVALVDCFVAFEKNWERDYNRSEPMSRRVRPEDMERIRDKLAAEFKTVFTEVLTDAGHEIVDQTGPDVLIVRPAIINLRVTAPDIQSPGFSRVIVNSAGSMTLFLELYDSGTNAIIARILDAQADDGFARQANRVTNKAEADRILEAWAKELAEHLDDAKETVSGKG